MNREISARASNLQNAFAFQQGRQVLQHRQFGGTRLGAAEGVADLQERLADSFQLQQQQPSMGLHISFGTTPGVVPVSNASFIHPDGFELTIAPDSLALAIDQRYRHRAHFAAVLEPVLATVAAAGRLKGYVRMGVRYINAAPATIEQFRAWFKPEYVGWARGDVVAADANRTWILITQILRTDAASPVTNGVIRYGFLQNGVVRISRTRKLQAHRRLLPTSTSVISDRVRSSRPL